MCEVLVNGRARSKEDQFLELSYDKEEDRDNIKIYADALWAEGKTYKASLIYDRLRKARVVEKVKEDCRCVKPKKEVIDEVKGLSLGAKVWATRNYTPRISKLEPATVIMLTIDPDAANQLKVKFKDGTKAYLKIGEVLTWAPEKEEELYQRLKLESIGGLSGGIKYLQTLFRMGALKLTTVEKGEDESED